MKKILLSGSDYEGIEIGYSKKTKKFSFAGIYDCNCRTSIRKISIKALFKKLDITIEECIEALKNEDN